MFSLDGAEPRFLVRRGGSPMLSQLPEQLIRVRVHEDFSRIGGHVLAGRVSMVRSMMGVNTSGMPQKAVVAVRPGRR